MPIVLPHIETFETGRFATTHRMCSGNGRKSISQLFSRTPSRPDFVSLRRSAVPHDFLGDSEHRRDGLPERIIPLPYGGLSPVSSLDLSAPTPRMSERKRVLAEGQVSERALGLESPEGNAPSAEDTIKIQGGNGENGQNGSEG